MTKSEKHNQLIAGLSGSRLSYSPVEAAKVTGRSRSRIFKAIRDLELTAMKDGRATLIMHVELERWLGSMPTVGRAKAAGVLTNA